MRLSAVADGFQTRSRGVLAPDRFDRAASWAALLAALPGLVLEYSSTALALAAAVAIVVVARAAFVSPLGCARCLERRWCPIGRRRAVAPAGPRPTG